LEEVLFLHVVAVKLIRRDPSLSLCITPNVPGQQLNKHVPVAINTQATIQKLLEASFTTYWMHPFLFGLVISVGGLCLHVHAPSLLGNFLSSNCHIKEKQALSSSQNLS
jgi:hypothetical protein